MVYFFIFLFSFSDLPLGFFFSIGFLFASSFFRNSPENFRFIVSLSQPRKIPNSAKYLGDELGYGSPSLARSPSGRRRGSSIRRHSPWRGPQDYPPGQIHPPTFEKRGRVSAASERKGYSADSRIVSPDYTVRCLGKRSRSPSPSTVYRPRLKDLLVEHDSSEYYGTTKLEQRSRSPSPTTSLQNLAQQRFFRPCSRATGSAAAAALATGTVSFD